ncbi:uncharacterized protein LOC142639662 [Castanea sativa]|uniref:uncharacterized protein LOC142639662 n=1 Tax=Castanea sativa TaxID=21020 RepID=UPI003F6496FC
MRQLIKRIEEYKRLEDDRLQNKGKAPVVSNPQQGCFQSRPRKDLRIQEPEARVGEVNVMFKELVHKIVDLIKNKPYFFWTNKMGGDPSRRNQNLYCTYHKGKGHITDQCRVLKDHLGKLVKAGYLKEFVVDPRNQEAGFKGHAGVQNKGVLAVVPVGSCTGVQPSEKKLKYTRETIAFDDDLEGIIQPHDDALMNEVLSKYDTPLVGFDGRMVILEGQISLPVNMEGKEVMVTFIVVASFSLYTVILGRPLIHAMGAVSSTLHVKVKFCN